MDTQREFVLGCGGLRNAIHAAMSLSRAFWNTGTEQRADKRSRDIYRHFELTELYAAYCAALGPAEALTRAFDPLLDHVRTVRWGWRNDSSADRLTVRRAVVNPLDFVRALLRDQRPDHELKYFVMQDIRHRYGFSQSSESARHLHALALATNQMIGSKSDSQNRGVNTNWDFRDEMLATLNGVLNSDFAIPLPVCDLFLECCRAVNYLGLSERLGQIEVRTSFVDAEYLMSRLFGLPTGIAGLDDLFGGGGLMLVEAAADGGVNRGLGGRAVLTMGPFGTGKSLLSLQMAVEVARKGGVAWVMPLEQTAEDCLYTLASMGCLRADGAFQVATSVIRALELLDAPEPNKGALILLRTVKETFEDFLVAFEENVCLMQSYPLRLIIVDPVSAMSQADMPDLTSKRARMLRMFESVKQKGTNIWLVAEENSPGNDTPYEQNIADTVIHLCFDNQHGYSQRYIEITKSRLQREQRGRHAFAVGPARGITVYPSPAAVKSRIKTRTPRIPDTTTAFGLPSLDSILGSHGLYVGDVIVLKGPGGCSKTPVGLSFLLSSDFRETERSRSRQRALLVSGRDNEVTIRHMLEGVKVGTAAGKPGQKPLADVRIVVIEGGYIKPGYILQRIENEFLQARLENYVIGRVMIDNVAHWELSCPYVREDRTFGDTLVDLLRRHRVTTLLTCGEVRADSESVLQQTVLDSADCVVEFEAVEFRGATRVMLRVLKTRDMRHRREFFEVVHRPDLLDVKTGSSLLRVGHGGEVNPVTVRLFLHSESDSQTAYNNTLLLAVQGVLSRDADVQSENPIHVIRALDVGSASAVDELQVLQLDEFQVPSALRPADTGLHPFDARTWEEMGWRDVLPRLRQRVLGPDGFAAVPFYVNVSLLAWRRDVDKGHLNSWKELAAECAQWEREHSLTDVFFEFPTVSGENYNCLFFEILQGLTGPAIESPSPGSQGCRLRSWITSEHAIEAMRIMHRLCRRAYMLRRESLPHDLSRPAPFRLNRSAQVWRHWYSTLNQMLSEMSPEERLEIEVGPLPGNVSVAGEWFLGVPAYSAAPDVGLRLIRLFTAHEAEMDRMNLGVGLPTRNNFYGSRSMMSSISPYFSMDSAKLRTIVEKAFCRSSFACYSNFSAVLSSHLQGLLGLADLSESELDREIRNKLEDLQRGLEFMGFGPCEGCHFTAGAV